MKSTPGYQKSDSASRNTSGPPGFMKNGTVWLQLSSGGPTERYKTSILDDFGKLWFLCFVFVFGVLFLFFVFCFIVFVLLFVFIVFVLLFLF